MEAFRKTLKDAFKTDIRFMVPLYQRPYVWTEERQWAPLWEDVRALADRLLLERSHPTIEGAPGPEQRTPPHFLGAVVLGTGGKELGTADRRLVIDGQQRLTTLQVLLAAAYEAVSATDQTKIAAQLHKMIENGEEVVDEPNERWKVWPTNSDRSAFVAVMEGQAEARAGDSRFAEAFRFFGGQAAAWLDEGEGGPDDRSNRANALGTVLQSHLQVVSIELEPDDNAQVIFETLNDRGERLLAADLVKNYVFQHAKLAESALDKLYEHSWQHFDVDKHWRQEVRQGRLKRPRIDVFLQHWLALRLGTEVSSTGLFDAFKELHRKEAVTAAELLEQLAAASRIFDKFDEAARDRPHAIDGQFINRWRRIDASTFTPVLLCLFADDVPVEQRDRGIVALESFLVRRMLCLWTTKQYNQLAIELAISLRANPSEVGAALETALVGQTAESRRWPTDDEVRKALTENRMYGWLRQDRVAMVFNAIENRLRRKAGSEQLLGLEVKLEIEHVLPQTWTTYWRFAGEATGTPEQQAERNRLLQQFGNLTITTGKINKKLSNHPWTRDEADRRNVPGASGEPRGKREVMDSHGVLLINKQITAGHVAAWDEAAIEQRQAELIEAVLQLWQHPDQQPISADFDAGVGIASSPS